MPTFRRNDPREAPTSGGLVIPVRGERPLNATPDCLVADCDAYADQEAPVELCRQHLWTAFGYTMHLAEQRAAAVVHVEPDPTPPRRKISEEDGWVYFIRKGDLVKIGWSSVPRSRFNALQPDAVLHIEPGRMADERKCHAAFAHLREHGEWFRPEPDLLAFIDGLRAA